MWIGTQGDVPGEQVGLGLPAHQQTARPGGYADHRRAADRAAYRAP
jgi:hypothetical protein